MIPRKDPYATLIQQFLENTQGVAQANEQRFVRQREERLIDEEREYDQQIRGQAYAREDEVEARRREQALTDAANAYRRQNAEVLRGLLGTVDPGSPEYQEMMGVFNSLLQPSTLTGQQAMDAATQGSVSLDGQTYNVHELIARYQGIADDQARDEAWFDTVREGAMAFMGDGTKTEEERLEYYNEFIAQNDTFFNENVRRAILSLVGINDTAAQQEIIDNRVMRQQDIAARGIEIARGNVALAREILALKDEERMSDLDYETAQARLAGLQGDNDRADAQAFRSLGILPSDRERAQAVAKQFGFDTVEDARAAGEAIYARSQRMEENQAALLANQNALLGVQISNAKFDRMVANWEFERTQIMADAEDATTLTTAAFAASTQGDIATLETLESLAASGSYPALEGVDFVALRERAMAIRGSEEDQRAFEAWQRNNVQANGDLVHRQNADAYVATLAGLFQTSDFTEDQMGIRGVDRDVDNYIDGMSERDFRALGLTKDEFRARLLSEIHRNKVLEDETAAAAAMDQLTGVVPPPSVDGEGNVLPGLTDQQELWKGTFLAQADMAGFDPEVAERIADGLLSGENEAFWKNYLDNERVKSIIEVNLANARRTNLETDQIEGALANAEDAAIVLTDEMYDRQLDGYQFQRDTLQHLIDSVYCNQSAASGGQEFRLENETECDGFKQQLLAVNREIQSLQYAYNEGLPWAPGMMMGFGGDAGAGGGYSQQYQQVIDAGLEVIGGWEGVRMDELRRLEQVDPASYTAAMVGVQDGTFNDAQAFNAAVAVALVEGGESFPPPPGNLALSDVDVNDRNFMLASDDTRRRTLERTTEYRDLVVRLAQGDSINGREWNELARQFGFYSNPSVTGRLPAWMREPNPDDLRAFLAPAVEAYKQDPTGWLRSMPEPGSEPTPEPQQDQPVGQVNSLVSGLGEPSPALVDAMFTQESGQRHFDETGNLVQNESSGAFGIAQSMPITAWQPGYGADPIITPSPEHQQQLEAWNSQRKALDPRSPEYRRITGQMHDLLMPYASQVTEEASRVFGQQYLAGMIRAFDGDVEKALAAYNAGPGNVQNAIARANAEGGDWKDYLPRPEETLPYIRNVLAMASRAAVN